MSNITIGGYGTCPKCGRRTYNAIIVGYVCPCERKQTKISQFESEE